MVVAEPYAQPALLFDVALAPLTAAALPPYAPRLRAAVAALANGLGAGGGAYRMEQAVLQRAEGGAVGEAVVWADTDAVNTAGNEITDAFEVAALWAGGALGAADGVPASAAVAAGGARRALRRAAAAPPTSPPAPRVNVTVALYVPTTEEADALGAALKYALAGASASAQLLDGLRAAFSAAGGGGGGAGGARRRGLAAVNVTASIDPSTVASVVVAATRPRWRALLGWLAERQGRVLGGALALLLLLLLGAAPLARTRAALLRRVRKRVFTVAPQTPAARFGAAQLAAAERAETAARIARASFRRRLRIAFAALRFLARARARGAAAREARGLREARAAAAAAAAAMEAEAAAAAANAAAANAVAADAAAATHLHPLPPPPQPPIDAVPAWAAEETKDSAATLVWAGELEETDFGAALSGGDGDGQASASGAARRALIVPPPRRPLLPSFAAIAAVRPDARRAASPLPESVASTTHAAKVSPRRGAGPAGARPARAAAPTLLASGARAQPPSPLRGGEPLAVGGAAARGASSRSPAPPRAAARGASTSSPRAPPRAAAAPRRGAPAPAPAAAPRAAAPPLLSRTAIDQLQRFAAGGLPLSSSPDSDDAKEKKAPRP